MMVRTCSVALLVSCGSGSVDATNAPSASASPFAVACGARSGRVVTVHGVAKDAKLGAILLTDNEPIYIRDLDRWPSDELDKDKSLTGCLGTRQLPVAETLPDGSITQGVSGDGVASELERER
jgi:hypothetical protein